MSHEITIALQPSQTAPATNRVAEPARSAPIRDPRSSIIPAPCSLPLAPTSASPAFTLIEILVVITLIGILATLTLTIGGGIRERGKISQAKVELAILATALEAYKSRYGDYPQMLSYNPAGPSTEVELTFNHGESRFFNALIGVFDPAMNSLRDKDDQPVLGKVFIEGARFTFEHLGDDDEPIFPIDPDDDVPNAILDPWEQRYQYFYKNAGTGGGWTHPGFVLYSVGPDGEHTALQTGGFPDYDAPENRDNIYAGRN